MGVLGIGTVIGSLLNYNTQQLNRQQVEKWNEINRIDQLQENSWQHANADRQFKEQKYLNRNQVQLQASDMQKAGMNPAMAMGVGSLSSGSYSSNSQAPQGNPYLVDDNALSHILDGFRFEEEMKMREKEIQAQKDIARINAQSAKYTADKSSESAKYSVDKSTQSQESIASNHEFAETLRSDSRNATQQSIANLNATVSTNNNMANNQIKAALDNANREIQMTIEFMRQDSNNARKLADVFLQKYNTDSYFKMNADNLEFQYRKMKQDMTIESQRQFYEAYNMTMQHLDNLGRDALTLFLFGKGR